MSQEYIQQNQETPPVEDLTLPHFEDERTVQLAQPVVPLEEVRASGSRKRRWLFAAAIVVAAGLGAATAALIYGNIEPQNSAQTDSFEGTTGAAGGFVAPDNEAAVASVETEVSPEINTLSKEETADVEVDAPKPTKVSKANARESRVKVPVRIERTSDEAVDNRGNWDDELAAEQERRRERREARRARRERRQNQQRSDQTTRIREIFEGSPRP